MKKKLEWGVAPKTAAHPFFFLFLSIVILLQTVFFFSVFSAVSKFSAMMYFFYSVQFFLFWEGEIFVLLFIVGFIKKKQKIQKSKNQIKKLGEHVLAFVKNGKKKETES